MADHFSLRTYALFILALLAAMLLCVCVGSVSVAPKDTLTAIFCALLGKPAPAGVAKNIIVNVRLSDLPTPPRRTETFTLTDTGEVLTVDSVMGSDAIEHKAVAA